MIYEFILFFLLIFFAGYLSAAEIAIASFGSSKINELKEKNDKSAAIFERIQTESNIFFGTIQITTNLSLTAAAVIIFHLSLIMLSPIISESGFYLISEYHTITSLFIALIVVSFFTMVFGILIPKVIGFRYAEKIGKTSGKFLLLLMKLFKYPVIILTNFSNALLSPLKESTNFSQTRFSEDEIRIIISEGVKSGALDETEQEIIENIFEFNDLKAHEVMIPRTEMNAIELIDDDNGVITKVIQSGHSILPVYENSVDNIIGVLHTKDLIKSFVEGKTISIKSLIRPAYFIPETKLISEILREMQNRGERLAVVTDEYGGTEGVITIEDILEEIVGELGNNDTAQDKEFSRLPDGNYYVLGSMSIDDFNDTFNKDLQYSDEYNTVAGFVAAQTGKILNVGEKLEYEELTFELIKKIRQKMVQFKIFSKNNDFGEAERN